jgi:HSP20 family protein
MPNETTPVSNRTEIAASNAPGAPADFWSEVDRLFQDFHDSFYSAARSPSFGIEPYGRAQGLAPALADVADKGAAFEITADLPGTNKDQIDIQVVGNSVRIEAQHSSERREEGRNFLRRERVWSGFQRQIELPEPVNSEHVTAKYENGVLVVTVPKAHPVTSKKVAVQ